MTTSGTAVVDDRGVTVRLERPPTRIVSLVPSSTETLFDLGLGDRVVGVTRFCVHPAEAVDGLAKVGGTKDVDPERVAALRPDLIVGNCEENTREIFDALQDVAPLYAAFPRDVDEAVADLERLARLVGADAGPWLERIARGRARLAEAVAARPRRRAAYLIWREPWMTVSADTFVHHMLVAAGLDPVFADHEDRFPTITVADLAAADPGIVLLSSEPFPFRSHHADALAEATGLPRDRFVAADGEAFTWHGTRMAQAFPSLARQVVEGFDPLPGRGAA